MSEIIYHQPPRRLAELMRRPGGLKLSDALKRAEQGLHFMQDACLESIDEAIGRVAGTLDKLTAAPQDATALAELYAAGDEIVGLAGPAQLEPLGAAAYSLCELVDRFQAGARVLPAAVKVHLDALVMLRRPPAEIGGPVAARAVLAGLKQVVQSV